jgi:hypothetical protein
VFQAALFIHWQNFKTELPVVTLLATAGGWRRPVVAPHRDDIDDLFDRR